MIEGVMITQVDIETFHEQNQKSRSKTSRTLVT